MLDIVPTAEMWRGMDAARAMSVYHWMFLAQPEPLPELLIGRAPREYIDHKLASWTATKSLDCFGEARSRAIAPPLPTPRASTPHAKTIARARLSIARPTKPTLPQAERSSRRCSRSGARPAFPPRATNPLDVWRRWANDARGHGVPGGHFLPEEAPEATAKALLDFFA